MNLDTDLVSNIRINLSAIERRTSTLTKRRSVKKEYQAAWLLKAISLIDLTTLSGDDTAGKVERLCEKAKRPISLDLLELLGLQQGDIQVGAVCVYHHLIKEAKEIFPEIKPINFSMALKNTLKKLESGHTPTSWRDALSSSLQDGKKM